LHGAPAHAEAPCQLGNAFAGQPSLPQQLPVSQSGSRPSSSRLLIVAAAGQRTFEAGWEKVAALVAVVEVVGQRVGDWLYIAWIPSLFHLTPGMTGFIRHG
jgi:hypothetical protein